MPTVLITGSNRGLGLEFARQYAAAEWQVIASCRKPVDATALNSLAADNRSVSVEAMDVSDHVSVDLLGTKLSGQAIDVIINNAGIASNNFSAQMLGGFDFDEWTAMLWTNTLGPMKVSEVFLDNLRRGNHKKIAAVSSTVGSLSQMNDYPVYPYATSKAALNKAMRLMAQQLKAEGITVVCLCPGHAKTDMGLMAEGASVEVRDAIKGMRQQINDLSMNTTGTFKRYNGETIAW
ncbi:MAG: SDR family oxidoreductase [Rhodospirillaceae bacterium]